MKIRTLTAAALAGCAAWPAPAPAQRAPSLGTATALGDAAVTESRRSDAVLWNAAAVGIYDGPLSSYTLLATDLAALAGPGWSGPAERLGLTGLPARAGWLGRLPGAGAGAGVGEGQVEWIGTQVRGFAVTAATTWLSAGDVPAAIGAALGADRVETPVAADSTVRAVASTVAVARGIYAGRLPLLGRVWLGATGKGWLAHSYARGAFSSAEPGVDVFRETVFRNIPGWGVDVGVLAEPLPRLRVGAAVSNVLTGSWRPERGARVREVSVIPAGDGAEVSATISPYLGENDGSVEAGLAAALWRSAIYPTVLRAGATAETGAGAVSFAASTTLREGGLDPRLGAAPFTVAFAGAGRFPVRASYAWGDSLRRVSLGTRLGGCRRSWSAGMTRGSAPWGTSLGLSVTVTTGSAAGCDVFHP